MSVFQPDELYFEEGDILYISDTVSKTSDFTAAFLCKPLFAAESLNLQFFFLFLCNIALFAFCVSLIWYCLSIVHSLVRRFCLTLFPHSNKFTLDFGGEKQIFLHYCYSQSDTNWWKGTCRGRTGLIPSNYGE